jgi:hypothetical protein
LGGITYCWPKSATGSTGDGTNRFYWIASDPETTSQKGRRASHTWWIDPFHSQDLQPLSRPNFTDSAKPIPRSHWFGIDHACQWASERGGINPEIK